MPTIEEVNKFVSDWADKKKYQDFLVLANVQQGNKLKLLLQGKPTLKDICDENDIEFLEETK